MLGSHLVIELQLQSSVEVLRCVLRCVCTTSWCSLSSCLSLSG